MQIERCNPEFVQRYRHYLRPLVDKLCKRARGEYSEASILQRVADQTLDMWIAVDPDKADVQAICGTSIHDWPKGRICRIEFCSAHTMDDWSGALDRIKDYARSEGCETIIIEGRKGWGRVFDTNPVAHVYEVAI